MTVSAETPIALSVANGVTTVFPYSFTVLEESDLVVKGALAGVVTTYTYGVDYLLSGVGTPSGSVDFTVAPANGTVITRYRASVIERETDYQDNGDLPADTLNLDLDRLWLVLQELIYGTRGSPSALRVPEGETIPALPARAARANTVPAFDSNGDPTVAVPASGSAAAVLLALADTSSAFNGDALVGALRTITGAIARTQHDVYEQDKYHIFTWMTSAQIADVLAGTNSVDVTAAINAANAAVAALPFGGTIYFATGIYRTTSNISIPNQVNWEGEGYPQTNNAGTTWDNGVAIYKAHGGDGVSMVSSNNAGRIRNIGVWSAKATWATGRGFVVGPAAGCLLDDCTVRDVGGDAFVIGDNTTNSYTNTLHRCYVNNPGGRCFVVGGRYFRGFQLISDGGTVAFETLSLGVSASLHGDCHFEGSTVNGLKLGADAFTTVGRVQTVTYAGVFLTHVSIPSLAAITNIVLSNLDLGSASAGAGSIGVNIGALCTGVRISDSYFGLFEQAIVDNGNRNQVHRSRFFDCGLPYNANGDLYTFKNNICRNTTGSYEIVHNSGTRGIWAENDFQKSINPVVTGVQGDFSGIKVRDNLGYVSRASGVTGSIASGTAVNHGLGPVTGGGAAPSPDIVMTTATAGVTGTLVRTTLSATQFAFTWAGTTPAVWSWNAHLPCDY